jgi:hypothetical protein
MMSIIDDEYSSRLLEEEIDNIDVETETKLSLTQMSPRARGINSMPFTRARCSSN